ncbi:hypothetical protein M9H77_35241 [Catharanthus roseus]|uniref:Uncharacterized protein n=1 Tax=Catharanthus roseus TaxID=4058 RepID=A0ACB9ZNF9_CATRO|nr:hypothetical protein M9H77_35241 [Catharanthus roseus]
MGVIRRRLRQLFHHQQQQGALSFATVTAFLAFLLLSSVSALRLHPTRQLSGGGGDSGGVREEGLIQRLSGPGSSPPSCRSKCGRCTPCKAVHVPIQPGLSIPLEYYPEAWRCKCGNKLFMP